MAGELAMKHQVTKLRAAGKILDGITLRSFEETTASEVS
jgi:hypothetical protein